MPNEPQSTGRRVMMLLISVLSFVAAYLLVRYLMRR